MARAKKSIADMFLPRRGKTRAKAAPVQDSPDLQAIWDVVGMIPRGRISTYGAVARAAGLPGRARLAGFALRHAPKNMNLPWQRVMGAGGRIVFPKASLDHREQTRRLRAEGVAVKDGRADRDCLIDMDAA